jgi:hypothetical protein
VTEPIPPTDHQTTINHGGLGLIPASICFIILLSHWLRPLEAREHQSLFISTGVLAGVVAVGYWLWCAIHRTHTLAVAWQAAATEVQDTILTQIRAQATATAALQQTVDGLCADIEQLRHEHRYLRELYVGEAPSAEQRAGPRRMN